MSRLLALVLACLIPTSEVLADTEFEDAVPLELVLALLGNSPTGEVKLYSDIMDGFPDIEMPPSFSVLGSVDRPYNLSAAYSTELDESAAAEAILSALENAAFIEFEIPSAGYRLNGFVSPEQMRPLQVSRYCHDQYGFVSYFFFEMPSVNVVTFSWSLPRDNRSCAAQLEEQRAQISMRQRERATDMQQYLPVLLMPASTQRTIRNLGSGYSSSNGSVESRTSLQSDWSMEQVYEHFKAQIEEQGWQLDSENAGAATASGYWVRVPDPDVNLIGTLTIFKSDDENYDLQFRLLDTNSTGRSSGAFLR